MGYARYMHQHAQPVVLHRLYTWRGGRRLLSDSSQPFQDAKHVLGTICLPYLQQRPRMKYQRLTRRLVCTRFSSLQASLRLARRRTPLKQSKPPLQNPSDMTCMSTAAAAPSVKYTTPSTSRAVSSRELSYRHRQVSFQPILITTRNTS